MVSHSYFKSVTPVVSCILPTKDRRGFLRQAIRYFQSQTYLTKELLIVDDGLKPVRDIVPRDERIRYIRLERPTNLGSKLNLGIKKARGEIIQKLDDDDYYAPGFLQVTVNKLMERDPQCSIVGLESFLVLIAMTGELKFSGTGWFAGSTLCFYKRLWEKKPFRNLPRAVDWWFLKDHASDRISINSPELHIVVRHQSGHTWTKLGKSDVTNYFYQLPNYSKTLNDILPKQDVGFYERLRSSHR